MNRKKVLIITYYWPPAGGIGVHRCLKIAKYLRDFGWEPVVYVPKNAQYPVYDYDNLKDIPDDVEVLRGGIIEPFNLYKMLTGRKKSDPMLNVLTSNDKKTGVVHSLMVWIRSNFFIPDARCLWIAPSVRFLLKYLKNNKIDVIFTDGPPHTNTMIACRIKEKTGIPWLADFQDPWTQVDYYKLLKLTKWADRYHHHLEQRVFRAADKITIVSETWKKDLESIGARNVSVIPWGYDPDDFDTKESLDSKSFIISHVGLMGNDRNPELFFEALDELIAQDREFSALLKVNLVGTVDIKILETVREYKLDNYVHFTKQTSRKDAINMMQKSAVLLLLLNKAHNAQGRIPGKLFEYIAAERFILALGPEDSDVGKILREVNAGQIFSYANKEAIRQSIWEKYILWKKGVYNLDLTSYEQYSNKFLTKRIAEYLNQITRYGERRYY